jgi:hypothetical protein
VKNSGAYQSKPTVTYKGTKVNANEYTLKYKIDGTDVTDTKKYDITGKPYAIVTVSIVSNGNTFVADNKEYEVCTYTLWNSEYDYGNTLAVSDISKSTIQLAETNNFEYDGTPKTIETKDITIKTKSGEIKGDDMEKYFEVDYYSNINIGKATIIIKAKPDNSAGYIGSKTATFQITKPVLK